ncbi:MAG: hypothetical protein CM1200mP18_14020 [Gammaproteobacteria bacterium]|nr:MAG: hypothetical protein CM1200mP18_14020 [Gammaproteobacteria bacterium]
MQTTLPILMPLIQLDIEYGITGAPFNQPKPKRSFNPSVILLGMGLVYFDLSIHMYCRLFS